MESADDPRSQHETALELQLFILRRDLQAVLDSQSNGSDYDDLYFGVKDIIIKNNWHRLYGSE